MSQRQTFEYWLNVNTYHRPFDSSTTQKNTHTHTYTSNNCLSTLSRREIPSLRKTIIRKFMRMIVEWNIYFFVCISIHMWVCVCVCICVCVTFWIIYVIDKCASLKFSAAIADQYFLPKVHRTKKKKTKKIDRSTHREIHT